MAVSLRSVARRLLGVRRTPTYYLPWLTRPGLECVLLLNNIEARFKAGYTRGPFPIAVVQYDADGAAVRRHAVELADPTASVELRLEATSAGVGFVTVAGDRLHSDLYVTLSDGDFYTATHGRHEFVEHYPRRSRLLLRALGLALALARWTIPAFTRDQYVYLGRESCSHLLLMNLSNVTNRIRVSANVGGLPTRSRLVALRPLGSRLLDVTDLAPAGASADTAVCRLRLQGNAWFNVYLVGTGTHDLAGPLSLMHVK